MGASGFCNVMLKESDIHHQHAKVHHFQHQTLADKKYHNPSMHWVQQKENVKKSVKIRFLHPISHGTFLLTHSKTEDQGKKL